MTDPFQLADVELAKLAASDLREPWRAWFAGGGAGELPEAARSPLGHVFVLRPFEDAWLARLATEFERYAQWHASQDEAAEPPNSMHSYGVPLEAMDLDALAQDMFEQVVRPLAARLYAQQGGGRLTGQYAFTVEYSDRGDFDLNLHVDDAAVTANLCLPGTFEGAELVFEGLRCPPHAQLPGPPAEIQPVTLEPGSLLLHLGAHRHRVTPIESGCRQGLILWAAGPAHGLAGYDARLAREWCGICNARTAP
ncbi:MAG: 2OG-Fe(II) oxygenase family protein [Planctomycetota bacterium]